MKWTLPVYLAGISLLFATAFAGETRTPAEWVAQLGADHLADRDAASAALLALGSKARDEVHGALDSPDAEVQWRARELWKSLRWLVVPDADADILALISESEQNKTSREHWRDFVKKHGAQSIRLMALFYSHKFQGADQAVYAVIEDANPQEVAQAIAHAGTEKAALLTPLDELAPERAASNTAINWMQIEVALWNYRKAYDFGRITWLHDHSPEIEKQCALAVERGTLFDQVNEAALKDMATEPDNGILCAKLSFYIAVYAASGKQEHIAALCDAAPHLDMTQLHGTALQQLIESFLRAGLPAYALKALREPQDPLEMYLRSITKLQMHDAEAAEADWKLVLTALDPANKATKEQLFPLGELMRQWHDQRSAQVFRRIVEITPPEPVYDANAYFRLGEIAAEQQQYRKAADLLEKGLGFAKLSGGVLITMSAHNGINDSTQTGEAGVEEMIKKLRALAAREKLSPVAQPSTAPSPRSE